MGESKQVNEQVNWALRYIKQRYGGRLRTPEFRHGWYSNPTVRTLDKRER